MQIFDVNKNRIGILTGFKDRSITTTLDSGDKEMSFQYPANAALVNDLKEECYIRTKTDEYVLKEINEADDFNTYTATLNVEELESKVFKTGFETVEKTIMECLQIAFDGTGPDTSPLRCSESGAHRRAYWSGCPYRKVSGFAALR